MTDRQDILRSLAPALVPTLILVAAGLLTLGVGGATGTIITEMMVRIMMVVGLYIFVGNSGILSYSHIGFAAIGAYASAWFTCCTLPMVKPLYLPGLPEVLLNNAFSFPVGLLSAVLVTGGVALGIGIIFVRLSGISASIASFAFLAIVYAVYSNWESVTAGTSSISNIPVVIGPGYATLGAVVAVWVAFAFQVTRYGFMLRASRDEPVAARSSGVKIRHMRLIAWVLSAIIAGIGGAFYGSYMGILTIESFYLSLTFLTIAMLTVGGLQSLGGAVVGVIGVTIVTEALRTLESGDLFITAPKGSQEIGLGIIMILILIFRPKGLMNGKEFSLPGRRAIGG
jgi:branched-chain amino acid transport system permease protein